MAHSVRNWQTLKPDAMIRQIVKRCHVGDSNLRVCRYVRSRLRPGAYASMSQARRLELCAMVINQHRENRELYSLFVDFMGR